MTQISAMTIVSVMATVPIATQTSMNSVFGPNACYFFWTTTQIYVWRMITSGIGMAIYRLICIHFLFTWNLNTKSMARNILIVEWILMIGAISTVASGYTMYGWEKAIHYEYCMDLGSEQAQILHSYTHKDYDDVMFKVLRFAPQFIGKTSILLEFLIYVWIMYHLWKHDKKKYQDKIITEQMRKERNHKNVLTLKGQVCTFFIGMSHSFYILLHVSSFSFDPSSMALSLIVNSTLILVTQLVSSHELKRFLQRHFH